MGSDKAQSNVVPPPDKGAPSQQLTDQQHTVESDSVETTEKSDPNVSLKSDPTEMSQIELDQTLAQQLAENEQAPGLLRVKPKKKVSEKEVIDALLDDTLYDPQGSPEFFRRAPELAEIYSHIRRIRGDGNCFYRAILTAQLERCFSDRAELERFTELCKGWRAKLMGFGFPELTTGAFCEAMETLLDSMKNGVMLPEILFDDLNVENDNFYVYFLRSICSGYLRENAAHYERSVLDGKSINQYCDGIEQMWRECDHTSIIALCNAIHVPIRIEYMDQSQAPDGGWHHDFLVEGETEPQLYFLYMNGVYIILYRKDEAQGSPMK